jgi:hypothetical protein
MHCSTKLRTPGNHDFMAASNRFFGTAGALARLKQPFTQVPTKPEVNGIPQLRARAPAVPEKRLGEKFWIGGGTVKTELSHHL